MSIRPLHDRVIVKRIEEERKTASGIVIPDTAAEKPDQGEVIAVGTGKVLDDGKVRKLDVRVGDKVLFGRYAGTAVKFKDEELLVLREDAGMDFGWPFVYNHLLIYHPIPIQNDEVIAMKRALLTIGALLATVSAYAQQHRPMDSRQDASTISSERHLQHFGRHERRAVHPLVDTERLAHVESSGSPKARNPRSGACGLYQLMPSTFRKFRDRSKANNCLNAEANRAAAFNYLNYLDGKHDGNREKVLREWHSGTTRGKMKPVTRRFIRMVLNEDKRPVPDRRPPSPMLLVSASEVGRGR